jgi:serine/threonine protein kinase
MKLLRLPNLRWVALSRNPFLKDVISKRKTETLVSLHEPELVDTKWPILGQGAGGITRKVTWNEKFAAVKTFAGELTSDGSPQDERAISVAAASLEDSSLIRLLGQAASTGSLVMEFLDGYEALAGPPSMVSCSRDVYGDDRTLSAHFAWTIAKHLLQVLHKLHSEKAICHGDFYAHNILIAPEAESVKLSDFGAAFFYDPDSEYGKLFARVELRSYSVLVEELHALVSTKATEHGLLAWKNLISACSEPTVTFEGLLNHFT